MTGVQLLSLAVFFGLFLAAGFAIIAYDVWVMRRYGVDATVSRAMKRLGAAFPVLVFAVGLGAGLVIGALAGHFWWSQ